LSGVDTTAGALLVALGELVNLLKKLELVFAKKLENLDGVDG
jgi:hypothetical protein